MQRTRITANLLLGVAVTAVSGCVSVGPAPAPSPHPGATLPVQDVAPQIVRPPAREALEVVPDPGPPAAWRPAPAPSAGLPPGAARGAAPPGPAAPRELPAPRRRSPGRAPDAPPVSVPALPRVPGGAGVCALGQGYGGWPAGSPQARICAEVYGR